MKCGQIMNNLKQEHILEPYISYEQFMMYSLEKYYSKEQQLRIFNFFKQELNLYKKPNGNTLLGLFRKLPTYYTDCKEYFIVEERIDPVPLDNP